LFLGIYHLGGMSRKSESPALARDLACMADPKRDESQNNRARVASFGFCFIRTTDVFMDFVLLLYLEIDFSFWRQ